MAFICLVRMSDFPGFNSLLSSIHQTTEKNPTSRGCMRWVALGTRLYNTTWLSRQYSAANRLMCVEWPSTNKKIGKRNWMSFKLDKDNNFNHESKKWIIVHLPAFLWTVNGLLKATQTIIQPLTRNSIIGGVTLNFVWSILNVKKWPFPLIYGPPTHTHKKWPSLIADYYIWMQVIFHHWKLIPIILCNMLINIQMKDISNISSFFSDFKLI